MTQQTIRGAVLPPLLTPLDWRLRCAGWVQGSGLKVRAFAIDAGISGQVFDRWLRAIGAAPNYQRAWNFFLTARYGDPLPASLLGDWVPEPGFGHWASPRPETVAPDGTVLRVVTRKSPSMPHEKRFSL